MWMAVLVKQGKSDEYVLCFFLPPLSPSIISMVFYFTHFDIWLIYSVDFPSLSGVHRCASQHISHFPRVNPSAEIDIPKHLRQI
jgi:hypothetical protein